MDSSGHTSAETNWSPEYIYNQMLSVRASFIKAKLNAGQEVGYENFKTIPCIKLIKVPRNECPCKPNSGCSFRKTEISLIRHIHISYVGSPEGEIRYDYVRWDLFEERLKDRYKQLANSPCYTFKNIGDHHPHYLHNDIHKRFLAYTFIPYNPLDYAMMPDCEGKVNHCLDASEVEFIVDAELEKIIFDETFKSLVQPRPKDTDIFTNSMKDVNTPLK